MIKIARICKVFRRFFPSCCVVCYWCIGDSLNQDLSEAEPSCLEKKDVARGTSVPLYYCPLWAASAVGGPNATVCKMPALLVVPLPAMMFF